MVNAKRNFLHHHIATFSFVVIRVLVSVCVLGVVCVCVGGGSSPRVILRGGMGFLFQVSTAASSWYYQWESSRHAHHPWWFSNLF